MRKPHTYRVILEDRSRLENIASMRLSRGRVAVIILALMIFCCSAGITLVALTPLHRILPGHLDSSERALAREALLRIDSISALYEEKSAYIDNILKVFDAGSPKSDPAAMLPAFTPELPPDSILEESEVERQFASMMAARRSNSLSAVTSIPSEAGIFCAPSPRGVVRPLAGNPLVAQLLLPEGDLIGADADGRVVASFYAPSDGWCVVIQHQGGFITKYSRLGRPLVNSGDEVAAMQAIARSAVASGRNGHEIRIEIWHNGSPIPPCPHISPGSSRSSS